MATSSTSSATSKSPEPGSRTRVLATATDRAVLPPNFFIARDVPHEWLFPRVSLAIHHGGAGTTHTAARAGIPQVILPFGSDQFFWASRVAARGVAPKVSRSEAKNCTIIGKMIAFAQLDSTRQKAKDLGKAMASENGVQTTVREIQRLVGRRLLRRQSTNA